MKKRRRLEQCIASLELTIHHIRKVKKVLKIEKTKAKRKT